MTALQIFNKSDIKDSNTYTNNQGHSKHKNCQGKDNLFHYNL